MASYVNNGERFFAESVSQCRTCQGTLRVVTSNGITSWWHVNEQGAPAARDHREVPVGEVCERCDVRAVIPHPSTFCKVTGQSDDASTA